MAEVRASSFVIFLIIAGAIGFVVLTFFGICGGIGAFKPELLQGWFKSGSAASLGYVPAKTPNEAVEKFRDAIHNRHYNHAAIYCTKPYADLLLRAHPECSKLVATIDKINEYGNNKKFTTDKTKHAFQTLDPFPKNFRIGTAPMEKGGKTLISFTWEPLQYDSPNVAADGVWNDLDKKMFQNVLGGPTRAFGTATPIEVVKEGDVWKLKIETSGTWETEVTYYLENAKKYKTALDDFDGWMLNNRFTKETYEAEIMQKLKGAK